MIVVTRLNGTTFRINPDLVGRIEETPDTHVYMLDGTSYLVKESDEEITEAIVQFRARVLRAARDEPAPAQLTLISTDPDDGRTPAPAVPLRPGK